MIHPTRWQNWALAAALTLCFSGASLQGDDQPRGITVTGVGEASARPSVIEFQAVISGDATLSSDAMVKYRDNRRRAMSAIESFAIDGLAVESKGFKVSSGGDVEQMQRMMMGQAGPETAATVQISEPLTVRLTNIGQMDDEVVLETLINVIDAAKDAGLTFGSGEAMNIIQMQMGAGGSQPLATFRLDNVDALKQQAYEQAMQNARANAERLATLAGVQLGAVLSIREVVGSTADAVDNPMASLSWAMMMGMAGGDEDGQSHSSTLFHEIPVNVSLIVQFDIQPRE